MSICNLKSKFQSEVSVLEQKEQYLHFAVQSAELPVHCSLFIVQRVLTMFFLRFNQFSHHVVDFKGGTHKVLALCHSLALCRILFQSRNPRFKIKNSFFLKI